MAFLDLHLPSGAHVASEAVTGMLMHLTTSITYGRYVAPNVDDVFQGLGFGGSLVLGSWTARRIVDTSTQRS